MLLNVFQFQRRLAQNREAARKSRLKKKVWKNILVSSDYNLIFN